MRTILITFASLLTAAAIVLALDPGRFAFQYIDVGGHSLRLLVCGHGSPTVVFEGGGFGSIGAPLENWSEIQPEVAKFATAVSYDRAGIGMSAPGPQPRDGRQIALELHTALHRRRLDPPYILVGHSFGGPLIRVFAGLYPDETAGLVLVDPTQEEFINRDPSPAVNQGKISDDYWKEIQSTLTEAHNSPIPAHIPVILITAVGPRVLPNFVTEKNKQEYRARLQLWLKAHTEWLAKIPGSQHIVTDISGPGVPLTEPELVIAAIRREVAQSPNPAPR
jgi:pimeloyl-ACP methyl ester carboxylesterase